MMHMGMRWPSFSQLLKAQVLNPGHGLLQKHPVCALVMRAFGNMLAEVPLIATRLDARRKGHARYLMMALEQLLAQV